VTAARTGDTNEFVEAEVFDEGAIPASEGMVVGFKVRGGAAGGSRQRAVFFLPMASAESGHVSPLAMAGGDDLRGLFLLGSGTLHRAARLPRRLVGGRSILRGGRRPPLLTLGPTATLRLG